jgi:hypothetical protein
MDFGQKGNIACLVDAFLMKKSVTIPNRLTTSSFSERQRTLFSSGSNCYIDNVLFSQK